jgi:hypothetical protein
MCSAAAFGGIPEEQEPHKSVSVTSVFQQQSASFSAMRTTASVLGALALGSTPALATLYTSASQLPSLEYDYIVVGGKPFTL